MSLSFFLNFQNTFFLRHAISPTLQNDSWNSIFVIQFFLYILAHGVLNQTVKKLGRTANHNSQSVTANAFIIICLWKRCRILSRWRRIRHTIISSSIRRKIYHPTLLAYILVDAPLLRALHFFEYTQCQCLLGKG